jgi:hypothetical protein
MNCCRQHCVTRNTTPLDILRPVALGLRSRWLTHSGPNARTTPTASSRANNQRKTGSKPSHFRYFLLPMNSLVGTAPTCPFVRHSLRHMHVWVLLVNDDVVFGYQWMCLHWFWVSSSMLCLGANGCGCHLFWVLVVHEHVLGGNCHMRVLHACQLSYACLACACRFVLWVLLAVIVPALRLGVALCAV